MLLAVFVAWGTYFVVWGARQKQSWKLIAEYSYALRIGMFFRHSDRWLAGLREEHRGQVADFAYQLRWRYWAFMALGALLFLVMWAEFVWLPSM
jgi:hypothetical protein